MWRVTGAARADVGGFAIERIARIYCAILIGAVVLGATGLVIPLWSWIVIGVLAAFPAGVGMTFNLLALALVAYPILALAGRWTPVSLPAVVKEAFAGGGVVVLHAALALLLVIAPQLAGIIVAASLAVAIPLRHWISQQLSRQPAIASIYFVTAALMIPCAAAAALTMTALEPWRAAPRNDEEVRFLGEFRHAYDVVVLGRTGHIAVLSRDGNGIERVDPETGEVDAHVPLPETFSPQRGGYHEKTGRLFVAAYSPGRTEETPGIAVVNTEGFVHEAWLPMPRCQNAINVEVFPSGDAVIGLCEGPLVYYYNVESLHGLHSEVITHERYFPAYDLEHHHGRLYVSSTLWPILPRGEVVQVEGGVEYRWRVPRIRSMAMGMASARGRLFVSAPLERRIVVLGTNGERLGSIATAGRVRDLAIDIGRGWLFAGGYFTGIVEQFDIETGARLASWQVGSLLRGVAWDPVAMRLYTASADGVHVITLK